MRTEQCEKCELSDVDGTHLIVEMAQRILGDLVDANVSFKRLRMIDTNALDCEWEDHGDGQTRGVYIHFFPRFRQVTGRVEEPYLLVRVKVGNDTCSGEAKIWTDEPGAIDKAVMQLRTHYLPAASCEQNRLSPVTPSMQP